jgi:hypothetical protein
MNSQTISAGELIYEAEIQITGLVEYGVSMEALSSGEIAPPPEGARFDQPFNGSIQGPKLSGRISGTDYLYVRADGRFELHIHATIETDDGHNISFSTNGVSHQKGGTQETQLRATVTLFSSSPTYRWVNYLQVWALGSLDTEKGKAVIKAYSV